MAEVICSINGCTGAVAVVARGLCRRCYKLQWDEQQDRNEERCVVDGCDRPVRIKSRGLCHRCYTRSWRERGDDPNWQPQPLPPAKPARLPLTCADCAAPMHWTRKARPQGEARCRECRRKRSVYRYGYRYAHENVQKLRGSARDQSCDHCGNPAAHWAYDHQDPNELTGLSNDGRCLSTYSLDPAHYIPLCRSCHYKFDEARREYEIPDLLKKPPVEWLDEELSSGFHALTRYMSWRRREQVA